MVLQMRGNGGSSRSWTESGERTDWEQRWLLPCPAVPHLGARPMAGGLLCDSPLSWQMDVRSLALCEGRRNQTCPSSLGTWGEEIVKGFSKKKVTGSVRDEMERIDEAEVLVLVGQSGCGMAMEKPRVEVNCYFLLAGPFGKIH